MRWKWEGLQDQWQIALLTMDECEEALRQGKPKGLTNEQWLYIQARVHLRLSSLAYEMLVDSPDDEAKLTSRSMVQWST